MQQVPGASWDGIGEEVKLLREEMVRQASVWHVLRTGVIYGVGFIIGSTLLTAILVSFGLQFFGGTIFGDVIAWIATR